MRWLADHQDVPTLFQFAATQESFASRSRRAALVGRHRHRGQGVRRVGRAPRLPPILANAIIGVSNQLDALLIAGQSPEVVADAAVSFCLRGLLGATRSRRCARVGNMVDLTGTSRRGRWCPRHDRGAVTESSAHRGAAGRGSGDVDPGAHAEAVGTYFASFAAKDVDGRLQLFAETVRGSGGPTVVPTETATRSK
jgi:hypothetical protein